MRIALAATTIAVAALGLTACGSNAQAATVTMDGRACTVTPAGLETGSIDFTVNNTTAKPLTFLLTENDDNEEVGQVVVAAGGSAHLAAEADDGDVYHPKCGAVAGADITPS